MLSTIARHPVPSRTRLISPLNILRVRGTPSAHWILLPALCAAAVWAQPLTGLSDQSQACIGCHESTSPGIVGQWRESSHRKANVGCFECHRAEKGDRDSFHHNGYLIATIVSPKDCSRCHDKEYREFEASHHSEAAKILGSLDNTLAEVVEGNMKPDSPASVSGCWQCHGSEVKVLGDGKLDAATWPNTGVGRLNPDGSKGSCSACHLRHSFSRAQARMPENCGRCHLGPDHPQMEVYTESKHGIAFAANRSRFEPLMKEKGVDSWQAVRTGADMLGLPYGRDRGIAGYARRGERESPGPFARPSPRRSTRATWPRDAR